MMVAHGCGSRAAAAAARWARCARRPGCGRPRLGEEQCPADETLLYAAELVEDGKTFQFRPRQPPGRAGWDRTNKLERKHADFCPVVKVVYGAMWHEVLRAGQACDKADGKTATALDLGSATECERVLSWPGDIMAGARTRKSNTFQNSLLCAVLQCWSGCLMVAYTYIHRVESRKIWQYKSSNVVVVLGIIVNPRRYCRKGLILGAQRSTCIG
jgi:hypothetical protein